MPPASRKPRASLTSLWLLGLLSVSLSLLALNYLRDWELEKFIALFGLQMGIYGYAAWRLLQGSFGKFEHRALIAILLIAATLRGIALFAPQALSTDAFRYVWDGRVQAAGINPYRYIPADPALVGLRDDAIYPNINRPITRTRSIPPPRRSRSSPSNASATASSA